MTKGISRPVRGYRRVVGAMVGLAVAFFFYVDACGAGQPVGEPGWSRGVVAFGDERAKIKELPIEQRPYRPLHVYGNTVRRIHHRGTPLPLPSRERPAITRRR